METRFKQIRKSKNMSQKEFSELLGISRSHVAGLELGNKKFLDRLINNTFTNSYPTVSTDSQYFSLQLESTTLLFLIYDTSGQLRFLTSMLSIYAKDCDILIFLYDLSKFDTLKEIKNIYAQLKEQEHNKRSNNIIIHYSIGCCWK